MGNCKSVGKGAVINSTGKGGKRKITLAILGLDNAGKTLTTKGLQGEAVEDVAPTIGFSNVEFAFGKVDIVMYDLGGGRRIRGIWKEYFAEVYGFVYVIDSSDIERMQECKTTLHELIEHPQVSGKPLLVLANKQDRAGALDELDICQQLQLEELVNVNRCPCRVETCAAITGQGKKLDKAIAVGFKWLLDTILNNFEKLDLRVTRDAEEQKQKLEKEKEERRERVRLKREERERQEKEERRRKGLPEEDDDEEDNIDGGNPWKTMDEFLKTKEEQEKAAKRLNKTEPFSRSRNKLEDDEETDIPSFRGSLSKSRMRRFSDPDSQMNKNNLDRPRLSISEDVSKSKKQDLLLSQSALKLSLRSSNTNASNSGDWYSKNDYDSPHLERQNGHLSYRGSQPGNQSDEEPMHSSRSLGYNKDKYRFGARQNPLGFDEDVLAPRKPIGHLAPLQPLESYESMDKKKRKKKKRFARKNQTGPEIGEGHNQHPSDGEEDDSHLKHERTHQPTPRDWAITSHSPGKASRSPRLDSVAEPEVESSFSRKWNLVDELPALPAPEPKPRWRGVRPNVDSDDIVT